MLSYWTEVAGWGYWCKMDRDESSDDMETCVPGIIEEVVGNQIQSIMEKVWVLSDELVVKNMNSKK